MISPEDNAAPLEETPPLQPARQNRWLLAVSLAIAAVLLFFAFRDLDWETFWNTLSNGNYWLLLILLPMTSLNYLFRALRWRLLVNSEGNVSVASAFWANMIGYLGNAFLPARAGELLRSAFLGRKSGLGTSFILATALTERLLDAVTLVGIGSLFLLLSKHISPVLITALRITALLSLCGLVVILLAPSQEQLLVRMTVRMPMPAKMRSWLTRFLRSIM